MTAPRLDSGVESLQQSLPAPPRPPVLSNPSSSGSSNSSNTSNTSNPPAPRPPRILAERAEDAAQPHADGAEASTAAVAFYGQVVVTWESALPVRLARKDRLGPEFNHHYAIRVTGLPPDFYSRDTGRIPLIFRLLGGATLQGRTRKRVPADYVSAKDSLIFAFPAASLSIKPADRYITFAMTLNEMSFKVRFQPSLMTYHSRLAL